MTISEAKSLVGSDVALTWRDRNGGELNEVTHVYTADFVPLYGPCLITDSGEIRLDRIVAYELAENRKTA